jgi:hypothetical protein
VTPGRRRGICKTAKRPADENPVTRVGTTFVLLTLAGPLSAQPPADAPRAGDVPEFLSALGLVRRLDPAADVWKVTERPAAFAWMTAADPLPTSRDLPPFGPADAFQQVLDRMGSADALPHVPTGTPQGLIIDPGRWRYQQETVGSLYRRKSKLEMPDPQEVTSPYGGRDWKAQEKLQIPVPIPVPLAEQLFVYGQIDGSGDAIRQQQTALSGKTGVGVKWALIAGSELQLRYATLLKYADVDGPSRAQPAVELNARLPLIGPLELEYTGSAIPAVGRSDTDQFKQELRFAYPLRGDNELEFGARYRWEFTPTPSPWLDRAQLFLGVKLRH